MQKSWKIVLSIVGAFTIITAIGGAWIYGADKVEKADKVPTLEEAVKKISVLTEQMSNQINDSKKDLWDYVRNHAQGVDSAILEKKIAYWQSLPFGPVINDGGKVVLDFPFLDASDYNVGLVRKFVQKDSTSYVIITTDTLWNFKGEE